MGPTIDTAQSRYEQISQDLRRQIMTGRLAPRQRMLTEKQLSERYGVSVLTVRQAQQALVDDGLIRKQRGSGTFVAADAVDRRRVVLVCGLSPESGLGPGPYFHNCVRFCQSLAADRGVTLDTVWVENYSPQGTVAGLNLPRPEDVCGFIFLGCLDEHPLLRQARNGGYRYVNLGKTRPGPKTVWFDLDEAARAASEQLERSGVRRVIVAMPGMMSVDEAAGRRNDGMVDYQDEKVAGNHNVWEYERGGYELIRRACRDDLAHTGFLFMDDVVARGGTRALLEAGFRGDVRRVCVVCGRQELSPLGLPVTYVQHDTLQEAEWALAMLTAQLAGLAPENECRQSHFSVAEVIEWSEANAARLPASAVVS